MRIPSRADVSPLSARMLLAGFDQLVRSNLRSVSVRGSLPPAPVIWAGNHHSWWDAFVASAVLRHEHHAATLVMDAENLASFGFLKPLGLVPSDRPRAGLTALREGRTLVILPEGELLGPGPMRPLHRGAGWYAEQTTAPLVPVSLRVVIRGHQHPEALVDLGEPVQGADLAPAMAAQLTGLDALIATADPREPLPGFRQVLSGRRSFDERIGQLAEKVQR
ncbi:1-acyl-sn-glycerol-3-phosphate acyltransferase [Allobranchiibius sp. CTAmp26]|uniref:lysophospholipid acyltransferase family protein n=1 Tax=Allobranchiibius sp. CTAmp26 TaxID=2815214 RepID=UPI001AA1A601|nr:lysophospholipid acyltransferase family protein [Allobranchiibius sp. CTAmp26]MBO1753954.1 1-acyl-sn-glycerol-3-phosphate acyltransferase [Allobranchiibius sp. CTAmp26]